MCKPIYNVAFVGVGFVAQQCHLPCFFNHPLFNLVALADPHPELRDKVSKMYGIPYTYSNHQELLNRSDIDAVVVTLPRQLTFHVVKDFVLAGIHVFTEKPICLNSAHGHQLIQIAGSKKVCVHVGYMKAYDSGTKDFMRLIPSFRDIQLIRAYCHMGDSYASPFHHFKGLLPDDIAYMYESFPDFLPSDRYWAFEQFINVFSHIMYTSEYIFQSSLSLEHASADSLGQGFYLGSLGDIPFCLELSRGSQYNWIEGISVKSKDSSYLIEYPPAFLRNVPASITVAEGTHSSDTKFSKPMWSWSFMNQVEAFYQMLKNNLSQSRNLALAVQQVSQAENVFQNLI